MAVEHTRGRHRRNHGQLLTIVNPLFCRRFSAKVHPRHLRGIGSSVDAQSDRSFAISHRGGKPQWQVRFHLEWNLGGARICWGLQYQDDVHHQLSTGCRASHRRHSLRPYDCHSQAGMPPNHSSLTV